jgi:hypothetical protein
MSPEQRKRVTPDFWLAACMVSAGLVIAGLSLARLGADSLPHIAQGTPPLQGSPAPTKTDKPAESKPGGTRPTTPAPEPARPDPQAQEQGAKPALPPAPAEKMAPPMKDR